MEEVKAQNISPENTQAAGVNGSPVPLRELIVEALKTVYDPEIPVDIYELGLIYEINIAENNDVHVLMTLTAPSCPAAGMLPGEVEEKVKAVSGVGAVSVEITFDPPWEMAMMSEEARLELGYM